MKKQAGKPGNIDIPASYLRRLRSAYRALERAVDRQPLLLQGSVNVIAPKSPRGKTTYSWTRKVRAKTVTVGLSKAQAMSFRKTIQDNRKVEEALAMLRRISLEAMLSNASEKP